MSRGPQAASESLEPVLLSPELKMAAPSPFSLKVKTEGRANPVGINRTKISERKEAKGMYVSRRLRVWGLRLPLSFLTAAAGKRRGAEFPSFHFQGVGAGKRHGDMPKWIFVLD